MESNLVSRCYTFSEKVNFNDSGLRFFLIISIAMLIGLNKELLWNNSLAACNLTHYSNSMFHSIDHENVILNLNEIYLSEVPVLYFSHYQCSFFKTLKTLGNFHVAKSFIKCLLKAIKMLLGIVSAFSASDPMHSLGIA